MFSSRPRSPAQRKGLYYEKLALTYLRRQGLSLLKQNFHCRFGEIDLILSDQHSIVFVFETMRGTLSKPLTGTSSKS